MNDQDSASRESPIPGVPPPPEEAGRRTESDAARFAEQHLGRASRDLLEDAHARAALRARLAEGRSLEDAVLGVVFLEVLRDRKLANEFFGYFFGDLFNTSRSLLDPGLRELMETGELVDSVVRDLWVDLENIEFRTRGQFLSFLLTRMQWKKSNSLKSAKRRKRGGDFVPAQDVVLSEFPDSTAHSPYSEMEHADDLLRLAKLSMRLTEEEREMFKLRFVDGLSYGEIGERYGLAANSIKKRILDTQERLRELF